MLAPIITVVILAIGITGNVDDRTTSWLLPSFCTGIFCTRNTRSGPSCSCPLFPPSFPHSSCPSSSSRSWFPPHTHVIGGSLTCSPGPPGFGCPAGDHSSDDVTASASCPLVAPESVSFSFSYIRLSSCKSSISSLSTLVSSSSLAFRPPPGLAGPLGSSEVHADVSMSGINLFSRTADDLSLSRPCLHPCHRLSVSGPSGHPLRSCHCPCRSSSLAPSGPGPSGPSHGVGLSECLLSRDRVSPGPCGLGHVGLSLLSPSSCVSLSLPRLLSLVALSLCLTRLTR